MPARRRPAAASRRAPPAAVPTPASRRARPRAAPRGGGAAPRPPKGRPPGRPQVGGGDKAVLPPAPRFPFPESPFFRRRAPPPPPHDALPSLQLVGDRGERHERDRDRKPPR